MVELRGIAWDHPRGLAPMRATAAQYAHDHPDVHITWDARSLAAFGEQPIEELAERYDLLLIDHPFMGRAARLGCFVPLDACLPSEALAEQAAQSVGPSFRSYTYEGRQWALAVDAAAHVSAYRADLLAVLGASAPKTWEEVFDLAEHAPIAIALNGAGAIDSFLTICANAGDPAGLEAKSFIARETGHLALAMQRRLVAVAHPESLNWSPPQVLDCMAASDDIVYSPLLFGYSNYARSGYAPHLLRFGGIPSSDDGGGAFGALLGGVGLAISASCQAVPQAADYAAWVASAACQRSLYVTSGGQPGNRVAWIDQEVNAATNDFFRDTLETLDHAYLRPRYDGFVAFHDEAGALLNTFLRDGGDEDALLARLEVLYVQSNGSEKQTPTT